MLSKSIRLPSPCPQLQRAFSSTRFVANQRLVILGSGWGGYEVLRGIDKKRWEVTMLSPNTYFNFTPLLASCAVGTLEFQCAMEPVRKYSPQVTAYQAWCDKIDFKNKTLTCMPATPPPQQGKGSGTLHMEEHGKSQVATGTPFTIAYDKLVIAVGAYSQTFGIPGVKEHGFFLKDIKDARAIRSRIFECFEQASQTTLTDEDRRNLLNFCIVGAGPTGVEFAAELHDLLHAELENHYPTLARLVRITLYDVAPRILGTFDKSLVEYTEKALSREGIRILTNHHVERVEEGHLIVKEQGKVPFGLLVWNTGLAPNPLVRSITVAKKDPQNRCLLVDDHLNLLLQDGSPDPNVWVIGDAARMTSATLPATAQVANQMAKYTTRKLNRISKDKEVTKPFEFHNQGSLAYIGNWRAVYDRSTSEGFQGKDAGRTAWLLWRSAYFTRTLSIRNKILVPFYWFLNWIFGRSLTRF